jgi:hypothetical protein
MALRSAAVRPTLLAVLLVACGGSAATQPEPATAPASSSAAADPGPAASSGSPPTSSAVSPSFSFPTACADKSADVCTPSQAFVDRLCTKSHQDVALALFASGTPFTRMYMRGKMDELAWDEEVLALRFHGVPKGGIQVGTGAGSYDVLRWDGSCSMAVDADMLTKNKPGRPKTAKVKWHRLGDKTQAALIGASDAVKRAYKKRGAECQGAMTGDVSAPCEKADGALVDAIVDYMRAGGSVPPPDGM